MDEQFSSFEEISTTNDSMTSQSTDGGLPDASGSSFTEESSAASSSKKSLRKKLLKDPQAPERPQRKGERRIVFFYPIPEFGWIIRHTLPDIWLFLVG